MCYVRSAFACEIILAKFPQRLQNLENVKKKQIYSTPTCVSVSCSGSVRRASYNIYGQLLGSENTFTMS